jgi:murein DD-endopeptidase MepM/ murein hydrolase activator NlpD
MLKFILNKIGDYLMLVSIAAITLIAGSLVIETQFQLLQQQTEKTVSNTTPNLLTYDDLISNTSADDVADTTIIKKAEEKVSKLIRISNFPVAEGFLSSPFGMRKDPIDGNRRMHDGIDIAANSGTKVYPMGSGKVIFADHKSGYGNTIEIQHGQLVITRYSHLKEIIVTVDQKVSAHDLIGYVGNSGRSTGPHLHLEVVLGDEKVDPQTFLAGQVAAKSKPELEPIEQTRLANVSYEDYVENLDGLYGLSMQ